MRTRSPKENQAFAITLRVVTALGGGYALANFVAVLWSHWYPGTQENAVMGGFQLTFLVSLLVAIWVFAAAKASRVCMQVTLVSALLGCLVWVSSPGAFS